MTKGVKLILFGVLTVASLTLALPFTPLRKSFSGITSKKINTAFNKMGVDFNEPIKNARFITKARSYKIAGLNVNVIKNLKRTTNPESVYSKSNSLKNSGIYSIDKNNDENTSTEGTANIPSFLTTPNDKIKNKTGLKSKGLTPGPIDLTKGTLAKPQAGKLYSANQGGGATPGVDPTIPPPSLPIGDGMYALLIFAAIFATLKIKNSISI